MNVPVTKLRQNNRFCMLLIILIWCSVWFSSLKINIGLQLPLEFLFAYSGILYLFFVGKFKAIQIISILGILCVSVLDFIRTNNSNSLMFIGFISVVIFFLSLREEVHFSRLIKVFFLIIPIIAILLKIIFPDWAKISTHDTIGVGGEEIVRFGLLGYESNSLAVCASLLMNSLIFGSFQRSKNLRIIYSLILIGVVMATFSRTGIVAVCISLMYGIFVGGKYQARYVCMTIVGICGVVLGISLYLSNFGLVIDAFFNRMSALDYFSDERSTILSEKIGEMANDSYLLIVGDGFMKGGASDNSILSFIYGYGLLGSILVSVFVLLSVRFGFSVRFIKHNLPIYIPLGIYLLTADIFGQAKVISVFFILLLMSNFAYKDFYNEMIPRRI